MAKEPEKQYRNNDQGRVEKASPTPTPKPTPKPTPTPPRKGK